MQLPAVSEPLLCWITSGEAEVQERESGGPWLTNRVKKGELFLTAAGPPYDLRCKTLSVEPHETMMVVLALPLLQHAFQDVFGRNAVHARIKDVSGFTDPALASLLELLRGELKRRKPSRVFVRSIGQAMAAHLARNYAVLVRKPRRESPSLPGYKLHRITDWMAEHVADEFNLAQLAAQAGLSKFYFNRLFKSAMGVTPLRYHITLRMDAAKRLLRETKKTAAAVAGEVGYATPSHFARLFRRETGLSPSNYRRQR